MRGIYPPVLADRGLADAVRALALDTPLDVHVAVDLPGEPHLASPPCIRNCRRQLGMDKRERSDGPVIGWAGREPWEAEIQ